MYRKYKPDTIFNGTEMLTHGHVLVVNKEDEVEGIIKEEDAGEDIQLLDGVLSPGFVNAHCHIELSHMKGLIPVHTGLVAFVQQVISKRERNNQTVPEVQFEQFLDEKLTAITRAVDELYQTGTVAVGDICNTTDSIELKKNSPLYWHNFIEVSGFVDAVAAKRFEAGGSILTAFENSNKTSCNTLVPHAPYSVSKKLFQLINEKNANAIISIHNQECMAENELYQFKSGEFLKLYDNLGIDIAHFEPTGKSSMRSWVPYFSKNQKIISVHNSYTNQEDISSIIEFGLKADLFFCICMNANLYIENVVPPIDLLIQHNCNIVMGTDSLASNWNLNMMEEIKSVQKYFPHISLETILQWATRNGAEALGIQDLYGSFTKGKKPGLVLIDVEKGVSKRL